MGDHFLEAELAEAKDVIPTIEGCTLIACVSAQVRVSYRYILPRGYKSFFMRNSTEHGISTAHKN